MGGNPRLLCSGVVVQPGRGTMCSKARFQRINKQELPTDRGRRHYLNECVCVWVEESGGVTGWKSARVVFAGAVRCVLGLGRQPTLTLLSTPFLTHTHSFKMDNNSTKPVLILMGLRR